MPDSPVPDAVREASRVIMEHVFQRGVGGFSEFGHSGDGHGVALLCLRADEQQIRRILAAVEQVLGAARREGKFNVAINVPREDPPLEGK